MIILRCNNPHNLPWTNLLPFILPSKHKLRTDTQPHSYPDTRPPTPPTIDISMMITSQLNQHGPAPNHQPDSRTNNYSCPLQLILPHNYLNRHRNTPNRLLHPLHTTLNPTRHSSIPHHNNPQLKHSRTSSHNPPHHPHTNTHPQTRTNLRNPSMQT
ncbi:Uncharacterised protein [Chlamydia abortus]|nr:Uncharacterised protein [Chlamydia abortus]SFW04770.1 Uncharacterised protein [Chlamydia abortus]SFW09393.1 Uncharacterised protein [Chlamydia abortus]SGA22375.1 Uncharacterised protein [Chlamydia abortus]SGW64031.1 Uncharacterised protein [Chlamydia abortus]